VVAPWRPHTPTLRSLEALAALPFDPKSFIKPPESTEATLPAIRPLTEVEARTSSEVGEEPEPGASPKDSATQREFRASSR
jgi:hypothetical protein